MAQNNSWKKYGGINNYDNLSSINVNSLVANNISLKNPYKGIFTICGELIVTNNTYLEEDLLVKGQILCDKSANFYNNIVVSGNADFSSNIYVHGNSYLYNPLYLVGPSGENLDLDTGIGTSFFIGDVSGVGLNKYNPEATLDISGVSSAVLNVYTTSSTNRNILARNNRNYGVVLSTDLSHSYIDFYSSDYAINSTLDKGIGGGGGKIRYDPSGDLVFDVSNNLLMLSRMSVSNRADLLSAHVNNETLVVYDNSINVFRQDIYNNPKLYNGTALSLISSDNSANTFLRITTPGSKGWVFGGGMYPLDVSRNMGTMGWIDSSNVYIPLELVVSGNSLVKNRATMGINTFTPETENYVMDINGPIHLHHNEIHLIQNVLFQVNAISFYVKDTNYGVAVGTSLTTSNPYAYKALYTTNGGNTWNFSDIGSIGGVLTNFTVFYYNTNYILIAGNNNVFYRSSNAGISWDIPIFSDLPGTIPSIYINQIPSIYRTYFSVSSNTIYYYDSDNPDNQYSIDVDENIYSIHGYFNDDNTVGRLFVAGDSLAVYNAITMVRLNGPYTPNPEISYKKIYTYDGNFAIAISDRSVIYTINGGANWNVPDSEYFPTLSSDLNDVCVWDLSNAIAVGNSGLIIYTTNSAKTWKILSLSDINAMGNGSNIINTSKNLTAVRMTDSYTFSIACVSQTYNRAKEIIGITDMFYLHLPDLFNRDLCPSIFDVSGNMTITGDIHINDYGKLQSNNEDFYILDKTVQTVYFARDASNIHIGNIITGGETVIQHRLTVFDDVSFNNRLYVSQDVSLNANLFVNKDVSFNSRLFVGQDVSFNANLFVNKDVSFNSRLFVGQDVSFNANLFVNKDVSFNSRLFVGDDVSFNRRLFVGEDVSFNANLFVNKDVSFNSRLFVGQDVSLNANLFVNKDVSFNSRLVVGNDVSFNSRLFVGEDVSFNANLFVGQDVSFNRRLFVGEDVSFNANLFVNKDVSFNSGLFVGEDVSFNANLFVNKDVSFNSRLFVGEDVSLNANLFVNKDVLLSENVIVGSSNVNTLNVNSYSNFYADVSMSNRFFVIQDVSMLNNVYGGRFNSTNYETIGDTINIGQYINASGGKGIINIGTNGSNQADIIIGSSLSTVTINGNIKSPGSISSDSKVIILNETDENKADFSDSSQGGLTIKDYIYINTLDANATNDRSITNVGSSILQTSSDCFGFNFKISRSTNTVNLDINQLKYTLNNNPNQLIDNGLNSGSSGSLSKINGGGLLILQPKTTVNTSGADYTIQVAPIDINNVLLKDSTYNTSSSLNIAPNILQVITTNIGVIGNISIGNALTRSNEYTLDVYGNAFIDNNLFVLNDVSLNSRLFVMNDVSFNSRLSVANDVSFNNRLCVNNDVSFNANLFVNRDVSMNANLFVNKDVSFNNRLVVGNDVSFNSRLVVGNDVSFNNRLSVANDVSFNNRLYVNNDVSFNANLFVNKDVSFNNRLVVGNDVSFNNRLCVNNDVSFNSRLVVGNDVSFNNRLSIANDVSFNNRLCVNNDVSFNSNLVVGNNVKFGNQILYNKSIYPYSNTFSSYFPISLLNTNTESLTTNLLTSNTADSVSATSGLYNYVAFVGSGTIRFKNNYLVDYLIIGGGGAGGTNTTSGGGGGGGGAGGIVSGFNYNVTADTSYNVVVGSGGTPSTNGGFLSGSFGGSSSIFGIDASGGGSGGAYNSAYNNGNGSGGGGSGYLNNLSSGAAVDAKIINAYSGGNGFVIGSNNLGGGGGGSGGAGSDASQGSPYKAGNGGNGTTNYSEWINAISLSMSNYGIYDWITYTTGGYIAGGGGGGVFIYNNNGNGTGGLGGGGDGGKGANATSGIAFTGSGGGGGSSAGSSAFAAGSGGSGIVIIRYKTPTPYAGSGVSLCNTQSSGNIVGGYMVSSSLTNNYLNFGLINNSIIQNPMLQMNYTNGYSSLIINNDVSFNNPLFVGRDVSMNAKLFVNNDVSFNSRLVVGNDVSFNNRLSVANDVSFNNRLCVNNDVSFNSKLFVGNDVSFNNRLSVANDVSFNNRLCVNNDVSFNSKLFVGNDVSFNNRLCVANDVSFNGKLFVGNDVSFNNRLSVNNDVSFNGKLFVIRDVSFNSRLSVANDVSFNNRLCVNNDVSFNSKLFVGNDVSFNSRLSVGNDVSFNNRLCVNNDVSFNSKLFVGNDVSFNNRLSVANDVSFNNRLCVNKDVSFNNRLVVGNDVSFNNRLVVGNDVSFNADLDIAGSCSAYSFNATSDYRIKENIRPVIQIVDNLNPIYYFNTKSNKEDIGLFAHELQREFPFLVTGEKDGEKMQSINYIGLIAVLIKEIQDLKKRVSELESKI